MKKLFLLLFLSPYALAEESILECRMLGFIQDNGELYIFSSLDNSVLPIFFVIDTEKKEIEYSVDSGDLRYGRNQKQYFIPFEFDLGDILFTRSETFGFDEITSEYRLDRITGRLEEVRTKKRKGDSGKPEVNTYFHSCIKRESLF